MYGSQLNQNILSSKFFSVLKFYYSIDKPYLAVSH